MRKNVLVISCAFLVSLVALFFTVQLFKNVKTDFATLLPENDRSVRQMRYILNRVGGVGTQFIVVSSPDFKANSEVIEILIDKIKKLPPDLVSDIQYNTKEIENFYQKYGLYYMEIGDLLRLRNLLFERISQARLAVTGMLLEDSSPKVAGEVEFILKKYTDKNPYKHFPGGYLGTKDGGILAIILRPSGTTNDFAFSKRLVDALNVIIKDIKPASYNDQMEVGLTGIYSSLLESFSSVIKDAISTAGLTIFLVVLFIYLYYRNLRMILILSLAIVSGILWTFAITYFKIGYLNQMTAFLGSIIVGNGINFGLIQMARYLEERTMGVSVRRSIGRSVIKTMSATGMGALTASLAYGLLSMTHFRGFSEFGFIGGVGMVLCWLASYLLLPPLLVFFEKIKPLDIHRLQKRRRHPLSGRISTFVVRFYRFLILILLIIIPVSVGIAYKYVSHDQFEYDGEKLGNKSAGDKGNDYYFFKKLSQVVGNSSNPAMLLASSRTEADRIAKQKLAEIDEAARLGKPFSIGLVQWLDGIFPSDQNKKAVIIRQMRNIFPSKYLELLNGKDKEWGRIAVNMISREPFTEKDMPPIMLTGFQEKDGTLGRLVYFSASERLNINRIDHLIEFGTDIEKNLPLDSDEARLASQSMIFIDIVKDITKEGPMITFLAYLMIGILVFLGSSKFKDFLYVYGFMSFGMLAFIAVVGLFQLKLNFFNFVVIPITIGIGVDYGINIYFRYKLEGRGSVGHVIKHTGGAVGLCSLTTIIGYGTMIIAESQSMASFGRMAIIGEFVIIIFAMVFMTAWLEFRDKRRGFVHKKKSKSV
jgi:hypothetical protein